MPHERGAIDPAGAVEVIIAARSATGNSRRKAGSAQRATVRTALAAYRRPVRFPLACR